MRRQDKFLIYSYKLLILLVWNTTTALGQTRPSNLAVLPKVSFSDKMLERNLSSYCGRAPCEAIRVYIHERDHAYLYHLSDIPFYEYVKNHSTPFWGIWKNRLLVIYADSAAKALIRIQDPTSFANLLPYAQSILPSTYGELILSHGLEWKFEVEKGRETWLWTSDGYDSRDIPVMDDPK